MFFDLLLIFIFTFVLICFAFTFYHQNKQCLQQQKEDINCFKYFCLRSIDHLWRISHNWLQTTDQFAVNWISYFCTDYLNAEQYWNGINHYFSETCSSAGNDEELIKREISELSNAICELYIDFWYQNVKLQDEQLESANFKFYCKRTIEEAIFNLYKLCNGKVDTKKLSFEFISEVESHLLGHNITNAKLRTKNEITLLLNLIDDLFKQVLPSDVNALLTNCNCCKNGAKKNCLQNSANPVRLFIYNLLIYSLLLPLIDRFTHPLYYLYNCINLASNLGGLSLYEFISLFENNDFYDQQIESQPVPLTIEPEDKNADKALLYEAIEESKKELTIFSKIQISNVKISTNEMISSISKMNPYIDYIIVYNVLECDRENEKQRYNLKRINKQTFLQRTYQVKRRFREFLSFQQRMEKNVEFRFIMTKISHKPSNIQFHSSTFLNYIKSTKITENSPLVKLRRDYLENFLNQLVKHKSINESKEFCEFLGYKYKLLYEVKHLLNSNLITENIEQNQTKSSSKNFELNFKNVKDFIKIFLPLQAKYGQLSTQIEDVMVNEQVCNKYSIMKIQTENNDQNHMVLKLKLDKWASSNTYPSTQNELKSNCLENSQINDDQFNRKLISCIFLLLFKSYFVFQNYFVVRLSYFLKFIFTKIRNIFTFRNIFKFYIHYLHTYLTGLENDSMDTYLVSYDRFYILFKDKDHKELFAKYVQCSKEKIIEHCQHRQNTCRLYLYRMVFFFCDKFSLFDNIITSFDSQDANKLLIYKLMQIFRNQIKT